MPQKRPQKKSRFQQALLKNFKVQNSNYKSNSKFKTQRDKSNPKSKVQRNKQNSNYFDSLDFDL